MYGSAIHIEDRGENQNLGLTVRDRTGKLLKADTDYDCLLNGKKTATIAAKNVGKYTVKIVFKGNYSGSKDLSFTILPKQTSLSKLTAARKAFKAVWKKQKTQVTGYEICYSTNKSFKKKTTKTVTIKSYKTVSRTIWKLKAKTKYFVKIRTYKNVKADRNTVKLYSKWSAVKSINTKIKMKIKTRTKQTTENWNSLLKRYSADILFFGITIFIPLFMENGYLNLTQAKAHALYLTALLAVMVFIISLFFTGKGRHPISSATKEATMGKIPRFCGLDFILLGFGAALSVSALFSQHTADAFWGNAGWYVGTLTMLALILIYFIVSRYYMPRVNEWLFVLTANLVIFLLTMLHSMGIDILGLHANIVPKQFYLYVSTVGNVNWLSGYLCIILPAFFVFFMLSTERASVILYGIALILGIINLLLCASESVFAGIWTCTFFTLPFICKESRRIQRLGALLLAFGMCSLWIGLFPSFAAKRNTFNGLFSVILDWKTALIICLLGCLCCFVLPIFWKKMSGQMCRRMVIFLEIAMLLSFLALLYNFFNSYDVSWGNYRGKIWNASMDLFQNFGFKDKLIGVGPELLGYYYNGLTSYSLIVLTAHNELLQWLLTTGVLGAGLWCSVFLWLAISYFRSRCWEQGAIAFFLPLAAYLGQAMVNSPNAMNIALFYLFLALYQNKITK